MRPRALPAQLLVVTALAVAGCAEPTSPQQSDLAARQSPASREAIARAGAVPLRLETSPELRLDAPARAVLERDARRFAATLTAWLYGDRRRLDVEPLRPTTRGELAAGAPFIPADQRGTSAAQVARIEIALQTPTTGIVAVVIADGRTSYRLPATFERHGHGWRIVHLNTH
jgi:hypothetical protein